MTQNDNSTTIPIREYSYWKHLNKKLILGTVILGSLEFILFLYGVLIGLPFGIVLYLIAGWALYDALPPKWVRDARGRS